MLLDMSRTISGFITIFETGSLKEENLKLKIGYQLSCHKIRKCAKREREIPGGVIQSKREGETPFTTRKPIRGRERSS